jgi:hypothetical protein
MQYAQHGTRSLGEFRLEPSWDAEHLAVPDCENVPLVGAAEMGVMAADLDRNGQLELVLSAPGLAPSVVLTGQGVPWQARRQRTGYGTRVVLGDSGDAPTQPVGLPAGWEPASGPSRWAWLFDINHRMLAVRPCAGSSEGTPAECGLEGAEPGRPGSGWTYPAGARLFPWAVADVNRDGRSELVCGTYGEERGLSANGISDSDSGYCIVLSDSGRLVWQRAFGAWRFTGCRPCVADLDADQRPEVVVACYTWQDNGGGLFVLDGATGAVLASTKGQEAERTRGQTSESREPSGGTGDAASERGRSFGSVGCADLDGDGQVEIAAAWSGPASGVAVYRFRRGGGEPGRLELVRAAATGQSSQAGDICRSRLDALCDLDGDGATELVLTRTRQTLICPDPLFYPSRFDSCELLVLSPELAVRQRITLPGRAQAVIAADVVAGGNIELVVRSDRLTLYSADRRE